MRYLPDHGLPLVQLKGRRREWSWRCRAALARSAMTNCRRLQPYSRPAQLSRMSSQISTRNALIGRLETSQSGLRTPRIWIRIMPLPARVLGGRPTFY